MQTWLLLLASVLAVTPVANAGFDFTPIIANLEPVGPGKTTSFTLTNLEGTKVPVQISIVKRVPGIDGKEVYKEDPATEELFQIFPDSVVLDPKGVRTVRVTYAGSPDVKTEMAFRIIAEELPIDLDDPNRRYKKAVARVTMSTRYIGSLYVTPKGAKPEIVIETEKVDKSTDRKLVLNVTNKGTAHQIYKKPTVKIKSLKSNKEITLAESDIGPLMSQNVLAGFSRRYVLPWPKELEPGPLKVTLDTGKE